MLRLWIGAKYDLFFKEKMKKIFLNKNKLVLIAEISANHNGSYEKAKKIIRTAKKYGADVVKLQTYTPDSMTIESKREEFKVKSGLWKGKYLWDLYQKGQTPFNWHKGLFLYAKKLNIPIFSTPFDFKAIDLLENLNCPYYKIASTEITHEPLIKRVASTKKPVIISTGMANMKEIQNAYNIALKNGASEVILLYCVSNYPSKISDFNFNNIKILKEKFKCRVGFSDHSLDNNVAMAAVASGAEIIEKHIALNNQKTGLDLKFSLKGKEIRKYKDDLELSKKLIGKNFFYRSKIERKNIILRRSIYTYHRIKKGEKLTEHNIKISRPAFGLNPNYYKKIIGKKSPRNLRAGVPLTKLIIEKIKIKEKK